MIFEIFSLLVLFQLKHFIADYPLQNKYMLQKFKPDWGCFVPLLVHASVHAAFTLAICLWIAPHLWWLALVDLITHFIMDRIKAGRKYLGKFSALSGAEIKPILDNIGGRVHVDDAMDRSIRHDWKRQLRHNTYFWWSLGVDQMVHHLVHYYIIFAIVVDKALTC